MQKLIGLIVLLFLLSCEKKDNTTDPPVITTDSLTVSTTNIVFPNDGGTNSFELKTNAESWKITLSASADWLQVSQDSGTTGTSTIELTASRNLLTSIRSVNLVIHAGDSTEKQIEVSQEGAIYPSYNTNPLEPDASGMSSNAMELAGKIKIGWNCGNTLEAIGGETNWGNPKITSQLIQLVKQSGFNAIRLPCSWNQYTNQETAEIKSSWLNRIKEVVQLCVNEDMYVILNIHWDGGWLEEHCTADKQIENNAKQKALWEQIATQLRDFDEHLLFASANEPNVNDAGQMSVLMSYHQTFINAVRSTGGKNSYRVLVVQGPSTDIEKTNSLMTTMPTDEIEDRLMAEIHYYTPYQFCLMTEDADWGKMAYYWGTDYHSTTQIDRNATWGEESTVDDLMGRMKSKFVNHGIPVILGEYAAIRRSDLPGDSLDLHLASRAHYLKYVTEKAKANGILPFYWDAGNMGKNASALFNRQNNTVYDQQAIDSLLAGAGE
jgi:endoglucanase